MFVRRRIDKVNFTTGARIGLSLSLSLAPSLLASRRLRPSPAPLGYLSSQAPFSVSAGLSLLPQSLFWSALARCIPQLLRHIARSPRNTYTLARIYYRYTYIHICVPTLLSFHRLNLHTHNILSLSVSLSTLLSRSRTCAPNLCSPRAPYIYIPWPFFFTLRLFLLSLAWSIERFIL